MSKSTTFLRNAICGVGLCAGVGGRCVRRGWCHMLVCILLTTDKQVKVLETTITKKMKLLLPMFQIKKTQA